MSGRFALLALAAAAQAAAVEKGHVRLVPSHYHHVVSFPSKSEPNGREDAPALEGKDVKVKYEDERMSMDSHPDPGKPKEDALEGIQKEESLRRQFDRWWMGHARHPKTEETPLGKGEGKGAGLGAAGAKNRTTDLKMGTGKYKCVADPKTKKVRVVPAQGPPDKNVVPCEFDMPEGRTFMGKHEPYMPEHGINQNMIPKMNAMNPKLMADDDFNPVDNVPGPEADTVLESTNGWDVVGEVEKTGSPVPPVPVSQSDLGTSPKAGQSASGPGSLGTADHYMLNLVADDTEKLEKEEQKFKKEGRPDLADTNRRMKEEAEKVKPKLSPVVVQAEKKGTALTKPVKVVQGKKKGLNISSEPDAPPAAALKKANGTKANTTEPDPPQLMPNPDCIPGLDGDDCDGALPTNVGAWETIHGKY